MNYKDKCDLLLTVFGDRMEHLKKAGITKPVHFMFGIPELELITDVIIKAKEMYEYQEECDSYHSNNTLPKNNIFDREG